MQPRLAERVAYGDRIRQRATCLLEAHGAEATVFAQEAAAEPGLTDQERSFWQAVAGRVQRLTGAGAGERRASDR